MRNIIIFVFIILFTNMAAASDNNINRAVNKINSKEFTYVLINGELKVVVPVSDESGLNMTFGTSDKDYKLFGVVDILSEIEDVKKQVSKSVCEQKTKPDNVTITIFFMSFTWDTNRLCKAYSQK